METKKYQLPKEFATKWVEALRSGDYKQGKGHLFSDGGYCCLGVACKVKGISDKVIRGVNLISEQWLPKEVVDIMPNILTGRMDSGSIVQQLAIMNDYDAISFDEIAHWIEQNVEFV